MSGCEWEVDRETVFELGGLQIWVLTFRSGGLHVRSTCVRAVPQTDSSSIL